MPWVANLTGEERDAGLAYIRAKVESLVALGFIGPERAEAVVHTLDEVAILRAQGAIDEETARTIISNEARCIVEQWRARSAGAK